MDFKKIMEEMGVVGVHFEEMMPELRIKALTDFPILIIGESGTGKELVAKLIHKMSKRRNKPLHFVNVPAISNGIFESELFGHTKGSFTDASRDRTGILLENDGGTVVLDEIGDMSPEMQVKLLRWLENGEIKPVGSDKTIIVDVRVIASTNKNLEILIEKGLFRKDLFYRLQSLSIKISPLRENVEAILDLTKYFVDKNKGHFFGIYGEAMGEPTGSELSKLFDELISATMHCPNFLAGGNARELESYIREWLFKKVYNHYRQKEKTGAIIINDSSSFLPIKEGAVNEEEIGEHAEKSSAFVTNIRRALIFCKGNIKNAAILLECSEEELLKIIEDESILVGDEDKYLIRREDIKTVNSFHQQQSDNTDRMSEVEKKEEDDEWLQEIDCNFSNPSDDELDEIRIVFKKRIRWVEKNVIQMAVNYFGGRIKDVKESLEIGYNTLNKKIITYGIGIKTDSTARYQISPGPLREVLRLEEAKLINFLLAKRMSIKNISEILGVHPNTVRTRIRDYNLK